MPEDAEEKVWAEELEKIGNRIQRLGAINLAAIEEYQVQGERKNYLDEQHNDLMEALETLDNAIRKIDRETRQRFKETFDQVNGPGVVPESVRGGNAYRADRGRPPGNRRRHQAPAPGKKNSTIHLLSGGVARRPLPWYFPFSSSTAPFCMLDEVDAPLDDANVGRYANMVKEMSKQVQFIYITHNKIAMELADQLMGVTMQTGLFATVSVDVDGAARPKRVGEKAQP